MLIKMSEEHAEIESVYLHAVLAEGRSGAVSSHKERHKVPSSFLTWNGCAFGGHCIRIVCSISSCVAVRLGSLDFWNGFRYW